MAFFNKLLGETKQEKINDLYNKTNDYFLDDELPFYNPGYLPLNNNLLGKKYSHFANLYSVLIEGLKTNNKNLLDLCCGRGGGLDYYKNNYNLQSLSGIDINEKSINFCKNKYSGINFYTMDINEISFEPNSFDIITEIDSFFHIVDLTKFFINIKNILKADGVFTFADETFNSDSEHILYQTFSHIIKNDITDNIIASCENIINDIDNLSFSDKEKEYLKYTCQDNIKCYKIDKSKFFHYTCYV